MLDRPPPAPLPLSTDGTSRALIDVLTQFEYGRIEPPILQDAAHFIDLGGETIRAGLYLTTDRTGAELCLRPEYTIPVCRAYLASPAVGQTARFSYCGPVFRLGGSDNGELMQAGLESYGRTDAPAADAEILRLALEAATAAGSPPLTVRFGDAGLLGAVLEALRLPFNWQRRLKRGFEQGRTPAAVLAEAPQGSAGHSGVLAALVGADVGDARALVQDLLAIAGISKIGGRSADEIGERFLAQVALRATPPLSGESRAILERFIAVTGHPDEAARALRAAATDARLDLARHIDAFEERTSFMAAHDVDLERVTYVASFVRDLDYYTGFVFEAVDPVHADAPVVVGGRYDGLAQALGHPTPIAAVGAAIWPDRIRRTEQPS